jgi:flagellar hook-associated protein 2
MGSITTGIGLISGIDTASLIDSIITLESVGKVRLQERLGILQSQKTALLDVNARMLNFKTTSAAFRIDRIFQSVLSQSSNEDVLTASATTFAQPGSFKFIVNRLVSTSQLLSGGYADRDTTPLGLDQITFEHGNGRVTRDVELESLNGGAGVARGNIVITAGATSTTIDLTDVTSLQEVLDRINENGVVDVTATIEDDHLVVTENGGQSLTIANGIGDTTASDLGINGTDAGGVITGKDINIVAGATALRTLNDGNGVLVRDSVTDFRITARDGTEYEIDLGRIDVPIDPSTLLEDLNNGAGVTIDDDSDTDDIVFVDRDGTEHGVDLTGITTVGQLQSRVSTATGGRITITIGSGGDRFEVNDTVGGAGNLKVLAGEAGSETAEDLGIFDETGVAADTLTGEIVPNAVDQARASTLQAVIDRIADQTGGHITAAISASETGLTITDTIGGAGNLIVESTATNPDAAANLGIEGSVAADSLVGNRVIAELGSVLTQSLNGGDGIFRATLATTTLLADLFDGAGITTNGNGALADIDVQDRDGNSYQVEVDGLTTVQDLITAFNTATGGAVTLAVSGQTLVATDNTGSTANNLVISDINGASVATELGLDDSVAAPLIECRDTQPLGSPILAVQNRLGNPTNIDLTGAVSLTDVIDLINAAGADITAAVNATGNGLVITDTSGGSGNLIIAGDVAENLGIDTAGVAADTLQGTNLQLQYVSNATSLDDLNYGRGVGTGSFRITDGLGNTAEINIGGTEETLYDVIQEINSRGLAVRARVNDNGDGLIIEEDTVALGGTAPFVAIKVESTGGTAAADLNLIGEASDVEGGFIDGSYEQVVDLSVSDSLDDVVEKINEAGINVSAAVINTGAGAAPFRLNLTSAISGRDGDLIVDTGGVDLGLEAISRGEDAKVFFGSDDPSEAFLLTSSTNTLDDVLPGVTIDLKSASDEAVTLTISRDVDAIVAAVGSFVSAFNDVVGRINDYDFYDAETEERGILLSDPTVARVRNAMYRVATGSALNVNSSFSFLSQVGVGINSDGELTFDQDKFRERYTADPESVEALFAEYDVTESSSTEVSENVTVNETTTTFNALGFGSLFDELLDDLTNSVNGTVALADESFDDQIELLNTRIEDFDARLERRRAQLQAEFVAMETVLARLQEQSNSLLSLSSSVALAGRSVGGG